MGMMDEMMESMIGGMTKEEKQEIMSKMMEKFFSGMTAVDKQRMMEGINMAEMMPRMMMGMMSQMMGGGQAAGMPMMGHMMTQMMPQCVSTMLPGLPKEERVDFVLKMISTLLDGASADMSEKEKNDLVARALERITA
jgi:ABC-type arginine transport system permease subunit